MRKLAVSELNRLTIDEYKEQLKLPIIVVLDNIRSMHNIGSVFRTADAFLIEAIYLCGITAVPPNKEIHKTALGATETVVWKYFDNTMNALTILKEMNYTIIGVEQVEGSINLVDFKPVQNEAIALVFGNEVNGIDENLIPLLDKCLEIPQLGTKHSFNVSVSAGIVMWDIFSKGYYRAFRSQ